MAVAKKDRERVRKDGKERVVPEYWQELGEAWLQGYDGFPLADDVKAEPVSDRLQAEIDDITFSQQTLE
ncbi:hypothetical protein [Mesorhizobium loti]|uniref:hypothetical protein n=1 Tax=Rhizobium loti TaxID=381 RepID=UPI00041F5091|nr:hypothetical protein [Mesorhizobium loti]